MARREDEITMEGVQIRIRNFSGNPTKFNPQGGKRTFLALLPNEEIAEQLKAAGIPIKYLKPREEGDEPTPFIRVNVNINGEPLPRFILVTQRGKTTLDASQESMTILDWSNVTEADLILSPYHYNFEGTEGTNVYLKTGYFKATEDDLDLKYADTPNTDSAKSAVHFEPNEEY